MSNIYRSIDNGRLYELISGDATLEGDVLPVELTYNDPEWIFKPFVVFRDVETGAVKIRSMEDFFGQQSVLMKESKHPYTHGEYEKRLRFEPVDP